MISADARLTILCIDLADIHVEECQPRYPEKLTTYIELLRAYPTHYPGVLAVQPSTRHPGMFALLDGHHRFCALIMAGRSDALCLIIEEGKEGEP